MVDNGKIIAPVSIDDIKTILGTSSNDLATLVRNDNIDKYAMYKPVNAPGAFNETWYKGINDNYGLTPITAEGGESTVNNTTAMESIIKSILDNGGDWIYDRPKGGPSSPFRLGDFRNYKAGVYPPLYMDAKYNNYSVNVAVTPLSYFRPKFNNVENTGDSTLSNISYSDIKQFQSNEYYLWMFYSESPVFSDFYFICSEDPISEDTVVGGHIAATNSTMYVIFALGNKAGNKFMTMPNSVRGKLLCKYPLKMTFYTSFFKEDMSLSTEDSQSDIELCDAQIDNILLDQLIYAVNASDYSVTITLEQATPLEDMSLKVTDFTMYFHGVNIYASKLEVNSQTYTGSDLFTLQKGIWRNIIFTFPNAFEVGDENQSTLSDFNPKLKFKGNTLINFGGRGLYYVGAIPHNVDGGLWYQHSELGISD